MSWVKKTFDKNYLEAFKFLDRNANKEVNQIVKLLKIRKSDLILDSCCGWGRHTLVFYKKGYKIQGVDISKDFIIHAKKNCNKIIFSKKDIRNINSGEKYNIILNLETSFGYYSDKTNKRIIKNFYNSLKEDGKIIIELINLEYIYSNFKKKLILLNQPTIKIIDHNAIQNQKKYIKTLRIITLKKLTYKKIIKLRLYSKKELLKIFRSAGFKDIRFFGNFFGEKYSKRSIRLIVVGQK